MEKTTTPKPPIHCVTLRQNKSAWVMLSMSEMQVAPVVVNPLIVSKKALDRSMFRIMMNGIIPMIEKTTHERDTIRKLSALLILWFSLFLFPNHLHVSPTI